MQNNKPAQPAQPSTKQWDETNKHKQETEERLVAEALGTALNRRKNQFGILVGTEDSEKYVPFFPNNYGSSLDDNDYIDDDLLVDETTTNAYVLCELREAESHRLLVLTGWGLVRSVGVEDGELASSSSSSSLSSSSSSWLVDSLDWQDFREAYRPGIGREEWVRICG